MGYFRSRARCVPLQYSSSATRGVKKALNFNKQALNQDLIAVSTPLQEKKSISKETLNPLSKEFTGQVSQSGSGMFYELSNRKRMECEKYLDCSWFQQSPIKSDSNSKLSLAETIDSFPEADEFDLSLQYANAQTSPWGDEYLEVFTDDILLEENYNKLGEKNKNFYASYKADEDNAFDSCNINFSLKKTDSLDSMKNISSTNPAEVIPISYKEKLNYSNYGLTKLDEVKSEIKKEVESYSPESNSNVMDSDDSDLNIGREEVVEEMNLVEDLEEINEKESINLGHVKPEVSLNKTSSDYMINEKIGHIKDSKVDSNNFKTEDGALNQTICRKFDLNLDISKLNFEQSMNVNTPDLDFMDLVDFINEEMRQENNNLTATNSTSNGNIKDTSNTNQNSISNENQNDRENVEPNAEPLEQNSCLHSQSFVGNLISTDLNDSSMEDLKGLSDPGVSIAERIKINAKRRNRKTIKDYIQIEDDESCESLDDDDDDDDDDDYDYRDDVVKRRCALINKRTKSSYSESSGDGKRGKEESTSYRERRDKNNEASRRSRQNRKARERHMYETLEEEERRNVKLKAEADVLEKQVTSLRQLLLQVVVRKGGAT